MAVAFIMDFPGGTLEDYDAVMEKMQLNGRLPAGALFHAVGLGEDGLKVCDVWESEEAYRSFAEEKIGPYSAEVGMAPPRLRSFGVNEIRRGASTGPIGFMQVVVMPGLDADGFIALDREVTGEQRQAPDGCVYHVNGRLEGDWCVMDYWTSQDVRDRFLEEKVRPAVEATGTTAVPQFEGVVVHNALTEPATDTAGV